MTSDEFEELLTEYGNACFDCGEWDDEDGAEAYAALLTVERKAKAAVIAEYDAKNQEKQS